MSGNVTRNVISRSGNVTSNVISRAGNEAKYGADRVQNGSVNGSGRNNRRVGLTARSKKTVSAARIIAGNYVGIGNIR